MPGSWIAGQPYELMWIPKPRNIALGVLLSVGIIALGLAIAQDQDTLRVRSPLGVDDRRFPDYLARLLGHRLNEGDSISVHTDGDAAFPAMLAAIDGAKHRVSFETYIFDTGAIPARFVESLAAAARRGVDVRMVVDAIGAEKMDEEARERLRQAGARVAWFNPVASYSLEEANYRTHRKALVVDGDTAFVGGIGIADQWAQPIEGSPKWRDTHLELRGQIALDVEAAFNENWIETGGVVAPDLLMHEPASGGRARSIAVWSSPEGGANSMKLLYLLAIGAARQSLDVQSPYFITDESTQWSLLEARKRGVRVRVLVEGDITDAKAVKHASRGIYGPLLEAGVEIYEYQPAMMHTKAMMIDRTFSMGGSANFDNRSLELNDELNVVIFDQGTAARLRTDFERDITRSHRVSLEQWRARPFYVKGYEKMWSYFGEIF
jgi:cardiolipin synthase